MKQWSHEKISESYLGQAMDAERYLKEIKGKIKGKPNYKTIFDDHLARFYVYNDLHGKDFLATKRSLLSELKRMLKNRFTTNECCDANYFEKCRKLYIEQEIKNVEKT